MSSVAGFPVFFALEHTLGDREANPTVWMLNGGWCQEAASRKLANEGKRDRNELELLRKPIEYDEEPKLIEALTRRPVVPFVFPVSPFRLNERLTIQKGVFLWTGDPRLPFEENVRALPGHRSAHNVVKLELRRGAVADAIEELYQLNISRATLFPGLDGFAQSLKMTLPFLERRGAKPRRR